MDESKYIFETFEAEADDFDGKFSEYINNRYDGGWKAKNCSFEHQGDKRVASCLFKRS